MHTHYRDSQSEAKSNAAPRVQVTRLTTSPVVAVGAFVLCIFNALGRGRHDVCVSSVSVPAVFTFVLTLSLRHFAPSAAWRRRMRS